MTDTDNSKGKRKVKVMTKRCIWLEENGKPVKQPKGKMIMLLPDEIKHFGSAVTKDFDEEE